MNFDSIVHSIPEWLNNEGPESGIVISSRLRLARNIAGIPYAHRSDDSKLGEIIVNVLDAAHVAGFDPENFFRIDSLDELHKTVFIERHLISPALAFKKGNCGVLVSEGENNSILINEEDHLRIQSLSSGFNPLAALKEIDKIDNKLSKAIEFSFSKKYGYLTACPTNIGTGLRASILIHLPALVLTKEIQRVIRSSAQLGLAIRGYYGEGSDIIGNLFQVSNQRSLGKNEHDIVDALISVVTQVMEYEKQAAVTLMNDAKNQTEDKIWRSIGILKTARMLSTREFMNLSSAARFGCYLGLIDKKYIKILNELLVLTQPGHLQMSFENMVDSSERDFLRAGLVRERFVDVIM
ncbi:protein arginine kinase [Candidatus Latescibacterota bacterium]